MPCKRITRNLRLRIVSGVINRQVQGVSAWTALIVGVVVRVGSRLRVLSAMPRKRVTRNFCFHVVCGIFHYQVQDNNTIAIVTANQLKKTITTLFQVAVKKMER